MQYDDFLGSQRWNILEIVAKVPSSPMEIADQLGTSVSYISQQLKLLEAAGLVSKERTGSAEKGKPRMVYSIAKEMVYLTGLIKGTPAKKAVFLDDHHKIISRIWMIEPDMLHYFLEKIYWAIEEDLDQVAGIFYYHQAGKHTLLVISNHKSLKSRIESVLKKSQAPLSLEFLSLEQLEKRLPPHDLHPIHTQAHVLGDVLKGGNNK